MDEKDKEGLPDPRPDAEPQTSSNRNIILGMGGFFLLGMALALLLFGRPLLDGFLGDEPVDLPQVSSSEGAANRANPAVDTLIAGDQATDFILPDLEGNEVSQSDFAGQPMVINFWATWCAPCRIEMPELQSAYDAYQEQGLEILAVNAQEDEQDVREFFDELGLTFTPLLDSDGEVGRAYGAFGLPSTYFVDGNGEITAVHRGILSEEQIDTYLEQILP